jgi:YVTN family beta-propeller protein
MNFPQPSAYRPLFIAFCFALLADFVGGPSWARPEIDAVPGMPPVVDPDNLYSEAGANRFSPATAGALARVYVPDRRSNNVDVIDPATQKVVDRFKVGISPQHIVPSWDLKTLWVVNNGHESRKGIDGSVTPIDPRTGKPGPAIPVEDPYNLYFTPDGHSAIVVAEMHKRLDFRDPHSMALQGSLETPGCNGINHADFSIDGRYAIFTCEFDGSLVKIDMADRKVLGYLTLSKHGMPQDIRISPDGKRFYVADMEADGVHIVDGDDAFSETGFIATGPGAHGLYSSRDGTRLYVANRSSHKVHGPRHDAQDELLENVGARCRARAAAQGARSRRVLPERHGSGTLRSS